MEAAAGPKVSPALLSAAEVYAPGLERESLEAIGEGISTTAFRMTSPSGSWVLRVSKTYPQPWVWHGGRGFEAALVRALETAGMPAPREISVLSTGARGLPSAFIERQVAGRPASADELRSIELASQLGTFLSRLHAVPVEWC